MKSQNLTKEDVNTAFMAWYAEAIRQYPDGLVTQAHAAKMLGVSRVSIYRLISRGYLKAIYFPKQPKIKDICIGQDDPIAIKILAMLGIAVGEPDISFSQACYVSFSDVRRLWGEGNIQSKCNVNWSGVFKKIDKSKGL